MSDEQNNTGDGQAQTGGPSKAAVNELANTQIGQKLRTVYDDVVQQNVPDRFLDLLNRLENSDGTSGSDT